MAKNVEATGARVAQLLHADVRTDKAAKFYWPLLTELFTYAANRISNTGNEPADNIVEIDKAMKTGFNWELGPFEMFDAAGVRATVEKMRAGSAPVATNVEKLLAWADKHGVANPTWYKDDVDVPSGRVYFDPFAGEYKPVVVADGVTSFAVIKKDCNQASANQAHAAGHALQHPCPSSCRSPVPPYRPATSAQSSCQ